MVAEPAPKPVGHHRGPAMNRQAVIVTGLISWSLVAIVASLHLLAGDVLVPIAMAVVAAGWVAIRGFQRAFAPGTIQA